MIITDFPPEIIRQIVFLLYGSGISTKDVMPFLYTCKGIFNVGIQVICRLKPATIASAEDLKKLLQSSSRDFRGIQIRLGKRQKFYGGDMDFQLAVFDNVHHFHSLSHVTVRSTTIGSLALLGIKTLTHLRISFDSSFKPPSGRQIHQILKKKITVSAFLVYLRISSVRPVVHNRVNPTLSAMMQSIYSREEFLNSYFNVFGGTAARTRWTPVGDLLVRLLTGSNIVDLELHHFDPSYLFGSKLMQLPQLRMLVFDRSAEHAMKEWMGWFINVHSSEASNKAVHIVVYDPLSGRAFYYHGFQVPPRWTYNVDPKELLPRIRREL